MLYIILLFAFIVIYLMMLMRRQKDKMSEIKIQIDQLRAQHDELQKERDQLLVQKFLNKWTIFLFCSILLSSNQKEH